MLEKSSEEFVKEGAEKMTEKDVQKVVTRSEDIRNKFLTHGPLSRFIEDGKLLLSVVKDYLGGKYRVIPWGVIASIVFSLIYVLNPLDLVPDVLPIIGQVDDVAVMGAVLMLVEQDLHKYKVWRDGPKG